jgi:alpha-glucosidase
MSVEPAQTPHEEPSAWWRDAVVYQVYVKSFADADGNGIGDLDGVTSRLPYLAELGVDAIWLSPCFPTPDRDGGYDVADYLDIAEVYGGLPALDRLLAAAHEVDLRVMLDIVPNHCSSEHAWFQAALREGPGGEHRNRFLFRDGRGADGSEPPNNWQSLFGGSAWTRVTEADGSAGQWYLHLFDSTQPDFDWRHPEVARYFEDVLTFWFDRGVDGFRIDVAHGLVKEAGLPDYDPGGAGPSPMLHHAGVHDVYRGWRAIADRYEPGRELVFVAEAWAPGPREAAAYIRADELHSTFGFELLVQPWSAACFRAGVERSLAAVAEIANGAPPAGVIAWTLNNHDVHRSVTRYGLRDQVSASTSDPIARTRLRGDVDLALGEARARAAALFLLWLPGPVYLYQGEELGLPEVLDLPDEARQDPVWIRSNGREVGRDGCRVPLPWSDVGPTFGFSPDGATAWLPQPLTFGEYAASRQENDPDSTVSLYRDALALRRKLHPGVPATLEWLPTADREDVVAYRRGRVTVVCVFGGGGFVVPDAWGEVSISSASVDGRELPGSSAAWLAT